MRPIRFIVVTLIAVAIVSATAMHAEEQAAEFKVENWHFTWTVAEKGEAKFQIVKTDERLTCVILRNFDALYPTAEQSSAIGGVLGKADEYFEKMRGSDADTTETVKAGNHNITFRWSAQFGFSITIRPDERMAMRSVRMDRAEAKEIASAMANAVKMVQYIDERIKP